ncbi:MAG: ribosome small subunit-dependent GTPase A [Oscillospiraceae bacterium]|nr:ribosome small subunit-dependent GTPase A [Oscillospiraceae bacterium]
MTQHLDAIVLKCIGGFYYVEAADAVYECRARGILRKRGISPVAGDNVRISVIDSNTGWIEDIGERRNFLIRPPVANIDILVVVASIAEPEPNTLVIDKMVATAEKNDIEPIIVITKSDLGDTSYIEGIYKKSLFEVFTVSNITGQGVAPIKKRLKGNLCALCGNSGVGKSSLLNSLDPKYTLETGKISKKLGRGRHTTRAVEIFSLDFGARVVDTPGFSSLDFKMNKDELAGCFREFRSYLTKCRFSSCSHIKENGCAVLEAVRHGAITVERHNNYCEIYDEIKDIKAWDKSKGD